MLHSAGSNCSPKTSKKIEYGETTGWKCRDRFYKSHIQDCLTWSMRGACRSQGHHTGAPCKAQGVPRWLFGPCSTSSVGVGWGTKPLSQSSRKPEPITFRGVLWEWEGWRCTRWCWPVGERGARGWRGKQDRGSPGSDWWKFHSMESKMHDSGAVSPPA